MPLNTRAREKKSAKMHVMQRKIAIKKSLQKIAIRKH